MIYMYDCLAHLRSSRQHRKTQIISHNEVHHDELPVRLGGELHFLFSVFNSGMPSLKCVGVVTRLI